MATTPPPDDAHLDLVQKTESMAREHTRKMQREQRSPTRPPRPPAPVQPVRRVAEPTPVRPPSLLDDVTIELDDLLRDLRMGWRRWVIADRITAIAGLSTFVGVLLPWTSDKHHTHVGLMSGGTLHALIAIAALTLLGVRSRRISPGLRPSTHDRRALARRVSLGHLLLGGFSTLLCVYFLVVIGLQRGTEDALQVRFGLYWTLASGMGLSYGGFARFSARGGHGER
jgi:hypothetical protein